MAHTWATKDETPCFAGSTKDNMTKKGCLEVIVNWER